jgi:hypothetical protein
MGDFLAPEKVNSLSLMLMRNDTARSLARRKYHSSDDFNVLATTRFFSRKLIR